MVDRPVVVEAAVVVVVMEAVAVVDMEEAVVEEVAVDVTIVAA
jgi:hypothetical protein